MKIDGGVPANIVDTSNISELAQKLNAGDVFRAKIIAITTSDVFLKLFDGSQVKASTQSPINANIGDLVDFEVKSNEGKQLIVDTTKPKIDTSKTSDLDKLLSSMGKSDAQSKDIAKTLLDNNVKVTPDSIDNIKNLLKDFKSTNLSPTKAVFLMQNQVPVIKENIELLNSFLNKEFNLAGKLDTLAAQLSKLPDAKIAEISNKFTILESMEKLPDLLSKLVNMDESKSNTSSKIPNPQQMPILDSKDNSIKNPPTQIEMINTSLEDDANSPVIKSPLENLDKLIIKALDILKTNPSQILNADENDLEKLKELFSKTKIPENITNTDKENLDANINETKPKEVLKKIFDSCFIKLDDKISPQDIDVKEVYKKILHRLSIVKDSIQSTSDTATNELKSNITQFDKQVNFINDINNPNNTFVQVPLNYAGNKNGELYIIKKKNANKSDNPDGTTLFLSLGTVNIGRFETLVNVKDKSIKIYMRLEDEKLIDFVKENYNMIYDLIDKTPYKIVDIKCKKIDEEISPINLQTALKNEFIGDTKSIDYKI